MQTLFSASGITDSTRILHTPGEFARKNLLYVQEVGRLKSLQPHKSVRESIDSFLFVGVLEGEGIIDIHGIEYKLKAGNCALLNCMDRYTHESSVRDPWKLMWVHFNGLQAKAYYELFFEKNSERNVFYIENYKEINNIIGTIMQYQAEKDLISELETSKELVNLLNICLKTIMNQEGMVEDFDFYSEIREYANKNYSQEDVMNRIAKKFDVNEVILNQGFKNIYGIELQDYILNRRFTAAKELLRFTVKPIKIIIEESGIRNADLFRNLFLTGEGMSAEEYRMRWAQWIK